MTDVSRSRVDELFKIIQDGESAKHTLNNLQAQCNHNWGEPIYDPEIRGGYRDPGDPVGTMGVDWRAPSYVPRTETQRWKRTCLNCAKTEFTTDTKVVKTQPVFR